MVSLLTALCHNVFLSFVLTSSFISTVSIVLLWAYIMNVRACPVFSGTMPRHHNPSKDEKSSKRINSLPKTFIVPWLSNTTFSPFRAVYFFIENFKDITEKAVVVISSHKTDSMQRIHIWFLTFITISLDLWLCRFLGDWLSTEYMMSVILLEELLKFLFLGATVLSSFYQKKPSICTNRTIHLSSHSNSSTSVHIWGKYSALAGIVPEIFTVSNLYSLWQIWDISWKELMHRKQYGIAGQVIVQSAQESNSCSHCQSSVLAKKY